MIRSMCCRLQLDLRELLKRGNGLFGSAEQTGSRRRGHDQLRAPRATCTAATRRRCSRALDRLLELGEAEPRGQAQGDPAADRPGPVPVHQALPRHAAQPLLDARRQRHQRDGAQLQRATPTTSRPRGATRFALRLLDHVRARIVAFQEETGHMYNLEATPAEGTTYRFAQGGPQALARTSCRPARRRMPYYTNSSQLPVGFTDDPFEALERQEALQSQVHRRHRAAPVHGRAAVQSADGLQDAGAPRADALPPALHHGHADVLDLPARTATSPASTRSARSATTHCGKRSGAPRFRPDRPRQRRDLNTDERKETTWIG